VAALGHRARVAAPRGAPGARVAMPPQPEQTPPADKRTRSDAELHEHVERLPSLGRPPVVVGAGAAGGSAQPPLPSPRVTGKRSARKRASWLPQPPAAALAAASAAAAAPAGAGGAGAGGSQPSAAPAAAAAARAVAALTTQPPAAAAAAPPPAPLSAAPGGASRDAPSRAAGAPSFAPASAPVCAPPLAAMPPLVASSCALAHGIEANAARAKAALGARHAQLCTSSDGLHFFAGEAAGALVLPRTSAHEALLDSKLAETAAAEGAINAVPGCATYVVVRAGGGVRARARARERASARQGGQAVLRADSGGSDGPRCLSLAPPF
jgi:hypothetical protein